MKDEKSQFQKTQSTLDPIDRYNYTKIEERVPPPPPPPPWPPSSLQLLHPFNCHREIATFYRDTYRSSSKGTTHTYPPTWETDRSRRKYVLLDQLWRSVYTVLVNGTQYVLVLLGVFYSVCINKFFSCNPMSIGFFVTHIYVWYEILIGEPRTVFY